MESKSQACPSLKIAEALRAAYHVGAIHESPLHRLLVFALALVSALPLLSPGQAEAAELRFEVSFSASAHAQPITGRVFVFVSGKADSEPRLQSGFWGDTAPFFGVDVDQLKPGAPAVVDGGTLGYPAQSLKEIPAGDYYVQALMNVYTEFHRSDGHTVWAHMDQWEGQHFNRSPGNLYSEVQKVRLDPDAGYNVKLSLTNTIPPIEVPPDTAWVKHVKIQSKLLTAFWGHPFDLGASVLLPKGYDEHPGVRYPVLYEQGHFSLAPPFGFATSPPAAAKPAFPFQRGYEFYQAWDSDTFPRMIVVTFQHPTPYFDDSYAVNSANNGPYGDALLTELIPYLEEHFRIIRRPYARVLSGGSTGGWESLALQLYHPDFFGGTWTGFPDPIDFRRYGLADVYQDDNAFYEPGHTWLPAERFIMRKADGQPEVSAKQFSQLEEVLGSHGRSAMQLEAWEAVYGPVGEDGYPKPLWDKRTGKIDHSVAEYMRDHGYDLRYYAATHWANIGPQLVDKIHVYCGDMDNYYLNLAVYLFEDFMKSTESPHDAGSFEYGRPMKGHGWFPMSPAELVKMMADYITQHAPAGEGSNAWKY